MVVVLLFFAQGLTTTPGTFADDDEEALFAEGACDTEAAADFALPAALVLLLAMVNRYLLVLVHCF